MGFSLKKAIKGVRNTVKQVASPVTRITEAVLKPVARPLRPVISKAVPFVPGLNLPALVLPAESFGIKNKHSVAGFKSSQLVSRVGTAAVGVVGAGLLAPQGVLPAAYKVMQSSAPSLYGRATGPTEDTAWNPEGEGGAAYAATNPGAPSLLPLMGVGLGMFLLTRGG